MGYHGAVAVECSLGGYSSNMGCSLLRRGGAVRPNEPTDSQNERFSELRTSAVAMK